MNRKRNQNQIDRNQLDNENTADDAADDRMGDDLNRLFELISLNDRFDLVVVPKTKRAKRECSTGTDMLAIDVDILAEDSVRRKILRLEKQIKDMTKKINTMDQIINNQCILKEHTQYIN